MLLVDGKTEREQLDRLVVGTRFTYDRWFGWWHLERTRRTPLFPFGFGLSYTTFAIGEVEVELDAGVIRVDGTVRNTGTREGTDVVQVYAALPVDGRPNRLIGFTRVEATAQDQSRFTISIPVDRLATRDTEKHEMTTVTGRYRVIVGHHAGDPDAVSTTIDL